MENDCKLRSEGLEYSRGTKQIYVNWADHDAASILVF